MHKQNRSRSRSRSRSQPRSSSALKIPSKQWIPLDYFYAPCTKEDKYQYDKILSSLNHRKLAVLVYLDDANPHAIKVRLALVVERSSLKKDEILTIPSFKYTHDFNTDAMLPAYSRLMSLLTMTLKNNNVNIDTLERDKAISASGKLLRRTLPDTKPTRVLTCTALLISRCLFSRLGVEAKDVRLTLDADDMGDGKLVQYYESKFGLRYIMTKRPWGERNSYPMEGNLLEALRRCRGAWAYDVT
jgi:hypothetical protein